MFYRILSALPGYGFDQRYWVAVYETLDYDSYQGNSKGTKEFRFAKTIEEARSFEGGRTTP